MTELSIIVPTFNEVGNIAPLVHSIAPALRDVDWEIIFVDDDSPDGTYQEVLALNAIDPRVRGLLRVGRRGLSSACVEGMLASQAKYVAVMDADRQHDESLLPDMFRSLTVGEADLVIGTRYAAGGSSSEGLNPVRMIGSKMATLLSRALIPQPVSDPMSGFFMMRRSVLDDSIKNVYGKGFKILLDIISAHEGPLRIAELPYDMKPRHSGESKLDSAVVFDFLSMLINRKIHGFMPARFFLFATVGLTGVMIHMASLYSLFALMGSGFAWSQTLATFIAMTSNFFLNNQFTFAYRKLHGRGLISGLLSFYFACGIGALINVALASFLFDRGMYWALSGLIGAVVAAIWNFTLSSFYTWRHR